MEKLAAHLGKFGILYIFVALAVGLIVGYNWNTWFGEPILGADGKPLTRKGVGSGCVCGTACCSCGTGQSHGISIC